MIKILCDYCGKELDTLTENTGREYNVYIKLESETRGNSRLKSLLFCSVVCARNWLQKLK